MMCFKKIIGINKLSVWKVNGNEVSKDGKEWITILIIIIQQDVIKPM